MDEEFLSISSLTELVKREFLIVSLETCHGLPVIAPRVVDCRASARMTRPPKQPINYFQVIIPWSVREEHISFFDTSRRRFEKGEPFTFRTRTTLLLLIVYLRKNREKSCANPKPMTVTRYTTAPATRSAVSIFSPKPKHVRQSPRTGFAAACVSALVSRAREQTKR